LIQYGLIGRTWAIATTALWLLVLLTGYVFVQYL
jgi:hypothetical protein